MICPIPSPTNTNWPVPMPVLIPISLELDCRREDLTLKCPLLFPPICQVPGLVPLPYRNTATIFQCHFKPLWFFSFQARSEFVLILASNLLLLKNLPTPKMRDTSTGFQPGWLWLKYKTTVIVRMMPAPWYHHYTGMMIMLMMVMTISHDDVFDVIDNW